MTDEKDVDEIPFTTANSFSQMIEKEASDYFEGSYIEALSNYTQSNDYDPKKVVELISKPLLEKIKLEAVRRKLIKDISVPLPLFE